MDMILLGDGERDENENLNLHVCSEIDLESKHNEKVEEKDRTMFEQYDQQIFTKQHGKHHHHFHRLVSKERILRVGTFFNPFMLTNPASSMTNY